MSFVAGAGNVNVDLVFSGLPRLPEEGEELYARSFSVQMGGGTPGTLINLSRLGVPTCQQTLIGPDMFSDFARRAFAENGVSPVNLYHGDRIPLNISVAALTPGDRTFLSYSESGPVTDEMQEAVYHASRGAKLVTMQLGYLEAYRRLKQEGAVLVFELALVFAIQVASAEALFPGELDAEKLGWATVGLLGLWLFMTGLCFASACAFKDSRLALWGGGGACLALLLLQVMTQAGEGLDALATLNPGMYYKPFELAAGSSDAVVGAVCLGLAGITLIAAGIAVFCRRDLNV